MLNQHGDKLRSRYGVNQRENWPIDRNKGIASLPGADPRLGYIFEEKMWDDLGQSLVQLGLAHYQRGDDPRWIGLHPKLADVYMAVLAAEIADKQGLYPVTDETINHLAVSGYSIERITQALLGDIQLVPEKPANNEIELCLASLALKTVLPKDITNVPVGKIIRLREHYRDELTEYQKYIHELASNLPEFASIEDPAALQDHLELEFEKNLKPKIDGLKRSLRALDITSVFGAMNLEIKLSGAIAALVLAPVNPVVAAVGAFSLSVLPLIVEKRHTYEETLRSSPAAYLLHLEEGLQPATLTSWVAQRARQFIAGV